MITASGSPFHFGRLMVGWLPAPQGTFSNGFSRTNAEYYSTVAGIASSPHVLIDPSSNASTELVIPFSYWHPFININGMFGSSAFTNTARLNMIPVATLGSSNAAAPTSVIVTFYVYFTNVKLIGANFLNTVVASKDVNKEVTRPPISRALSTASTVLTSLRNVPMVGSILGVAGSVAGASSEVANLLGFSKPSIDPANLQMVKHLQMGSMSNTQGVSTSLKLTHNPAQGISPDPTAVGFPGEDIMSYQFIASQWGYLGKFSWATTKVAGDLLQTILVNPGLIGVAAPVYRNMPPLAHLALAHTFWRGSLEYRFIVVTSPLVRGRMSLRHVPYSGDTLAPGGFGSVTSDTCVIELGTQNTFDITVPWTSTATALNVGLGLMNDAGTTLSVLGHGATTLNSNGFLVAEVQSAISTQYTPVTLDVLVYVRGGPDLQLFDPVTPMLNLTGVRTILASRDSGLDKPAEQPMICKLGAKSFDLKDTTSAIFGEVVTSVRSLLKRREYLTTFPMSSGVVTTGWFYYPLFMCPPYVADSSGSNPIAPVLPLGYTQYDWFTRAYLGVRGGVRYSGVFWQDNADNTTGQVMTPLGMVHRSTLVDSNIGYTSYPAVGGNSSVPLNPTSPTTSNGCELFTDGSFDIEIPDSSPTLYRSQKIAPSGTTNYALYGNQVSTTASAMVFIKGVVTTANSPVYMTTYFAVADDFTCVGYIGPPLVNFNI